MILIAGPCVVEDFDTCAKVAEQLVILQERHSDKLHCIFKSSFDKANRSSIDSFRSIGLSESIEILCLIHDKFNLPITTDFHTCEQVKQWGSYFDIIQIPALLCRQTDLITSAALVYATVDTDACIINIKKGQFMSPQDMAGPVEKARVANPNCEVWITERGTCFGYNRLVVDFTGFAAMRDHAKPDKLIMDCTHSNNGDRSLTPLLARAAMDVGSDGLFIECHPDPDKAKCDGPNSLDLKDLGPLVDGIIAKYTV